MNYTFTDIHGSTVDWSAYLGKPCKLISGHDKPITELELERLCRLKTLECALSKALLNCKQQGQSQMARDLYRQIID